MGCLLRLSHVYNKPREAKQTLPSIWKRSCKPSVTPNCVKSFTAKWTACSNLIFLKKIISGLRQMQAADLHQMYSDAYPTPEAGRLSQLAVAYNVHEHCSSGSTEDTLSKMTETLLM